MTNTQPMTRINWAFVGKGMGAYLGLSGLMVFAVVIRDAVFLPTFGAIGAQWAGAAIAIMFVYGFTALILHMIQEPRSPLDHWVLGGVWAIVTAGLHAFVILRMLKAPIAEWALAYDVLGGQAWPFILIGLGLSPVLVARQAARVPSS